MMIGHCLHHLQKLLIAIPSKRIFNDLQILDLRPCFGFDRFPGNTDIALSEESTRKRSIADQGNAMIKAVLLHLLFRTAVKEGILRLHGYDGNARIHEHRKMLCVEIGS